MNLTGNDFSYFLFLEIGLYLTDFPASWLCGNQWLLNWNFDQHDGWNRCDFLKGAKKIKSLNPDGKLKKE